MERLRLIIWTGFERSNGGLQNENKLDEQNFKEASIMEIELRGINLYK